jgi:integrase
VVGLKPGPDGRRRRKKVSGTNKTEVRAKLAELHDELNDGVVTNAVYTVAQAINDWLADGLAGRAPKTVSTQREVLEPLIGIIGAVPLRELTAATVRSALKELAATRATRTVAMTHAGLTRAIRHAEANDKVRRNVATLVDTPVGQGGRPSKSLTFGQAVALIRAARSYGLYAYVVLSLLVGVRTEEARALRWDHVDLEGNPDADPPVPPHVDVWRSVRAHGDTKTKKSRRSLGLPKMAVEVLREHLQGQADARLRAGVLWQDNGLVFTTALGTQLDAADVRRSLRTICRKAGLGEEWTPRELRHTFVSCCPTTGWRSRRSAASWATVHRTLPRRSIATRSDRSSPSGPRRWTRSSPTSIDLPHGSRCLTAVTATGEDDDAPSRVVRVWSTAHPRLTAVWSRPAEARFQV